MLSSKIIIILASVYLSPYTSANTTVCSHRNLMMCAKGQVFLCKGGGRMPALLNTMTSAYCIPVLFRYIFCSTSSVPAVQETLSPPSNIWTLFTRLKRNMNISTNRQTLFYDLWTTMMLLNDYHCGRKLSVQECRSLRYTIARWGTRNSFCNGPRDYCARNISDLECGQPWYTHHPILNGWRQSPELKHAYCQALQCVMNSSCKHLVVISHVVINSFTESDLYR